MPAEMCEDSTSTSPYQQKPSAICEMPVLSVSAQWDKAPSKSWWQLMSICMCISNGFVLMLGQINYRSETCQPLTIWQHTLNRQQTHCWVSRKQWQVQVQHVSEWAIKHPATHICSAIIIRCPTSRRTYKGSSKGPSVNRIKAPPTPVWQQTQNFFPYGECEVMWWNGKTSWKDWV